MKKSLFTHLHVHTHYSLLDGAIRIPDLLAKCKTFGMDSVAITDHGTMHGALAFYQQAKGKGIKPIIGCDMYIAPGERIVRNPGAPTIRYSLVLLAMNYNGYRNLINLSTRAHLEDFSQKPHINMECLREYHKNLICLSGSFDNGEIPRLLANKKFEIAHKRARELKELFGDRFYIELQSNGRPGEEILRNRLKDLASELEIKVLATNDCHYLNREDAHAHEVLLCIQTGRTINDPKHYHFSSDTFHFKSPDEMSANFCECPEAITNTREVTERCNLELPEGEQHLPEYPTLEGESQEEVFRKACLHGFAKRLGTMKGLSLEKKKDYRQRLNHEMAAITSRQLNGSFLILADTIRWAKEQRIRVGPGRGTITGSLVAYALEITNIDPLETNLIFERFLNQYGRDVPVFAVDICTSGRDKVIDYLREKLSDGVSSPHVAHLLSWQDMRARHTIRDVGNTLDLPSETIEKVIRLIPNELNLSLASAITKCPKLKKFIDKNPHIAELFSVAMTLEGCPRHKATHTAGLVISYPEPLTEYIPLCKNHEGAILTQYSLLGTETSGLLHFDYLSLTTLDVIEKTLSHISESGIDIENFPMDDGQTYKMLCAGDTSGIFQFEYSGMTELLTRIAPKRFSDLVLLVALYRPGPLDCGMMDDFIEARHGREPATYPLSEIKPILEETYGVIVYQEQVMKIVQVIADFSFDEAETFRRVLSKKIPEEVNLQKVKFMKRVTNKRVDEKKAKVIYTLLSRYTPYTFPKAHSIAYATISYQVAFLKAQYPREFMAALLSCWVNDEKKFRNYCKEAQNMNISLLLPDVNTSSIDCTPENSCVRLGLNTLKIGRSVQRKIIDGRNVNGPYTSSINFLDRVKTVSDRGFAVLLEAGAFDSIREKELKDLMTKMARGYSGFLLNETEIEQLMHAYCRACSGEKTYFHLPKGVSKELVSLYLISVLADIPIEQLLGDKLEDEKHWVSLARITERLSGIQLNIGSPITKTTRKP